MENSNNRGKAKRINQILKIYVYLVVSSARAGAGVAVGQGDQGGTQK